MSAKRLLALAMIVVLMVFAIRFISNQVQVVDGVSKEGYIIYFASDTDVGLVPEYRIGRPSVYNRLASLLAGPENPGLSGIFPQGTRIISLQQIDDLLYINFSRELITRHYGGSSGELVTVYGLVNTITEDPTVKRVQILIEGKLAATIAGHVDISVPLTRDLSFVLNTNTI